MEFEQIDEQQPEQRIAIYSKWAILGFSVVFSPIVGAILLMLNLRSVGLKKEGTSILLFAIAYRIIAGTLLSSLIQFPPNTSALAMLTNTRSIMYSLALDIIGGGILAEYFFKKYFPADNYEYKSILRPLLTMVLIMLVVSFLFKLV